MPFSIMWKKEMFCQDVLRDDPLLGLYVLIVHAARNLMVFFVDALTEDQYHIDENLTNGGSERKGGG